MEKLLPFLPGQGSQRGILDRPKLLQHRFQLLLAEGQGKERVGATVDQTRPALGPFVIAQCVEQNDGGRLVEPKLSTERGGNNTPKSKVHKPDLDEMGIATWHEVLPARGKKVARPRKPTLDEMGPGTESKIFQPKDSRQSGPEFGPVARSTGGAPGHRGGWKKK